MAMTWRDVTIPLHPGMTLWPGDPPFELSPLRRVTQGASSNTSALRLSTHTGTHMDAPWHFEEDGKRLEDVDTALFFGDALLIDLPDADTVAARDLGAADLPPRVLIKTRNSHYPADDPFHKDYAALGEDAAQRLVDEGVRLVGVDYLSDAPYKQEGHATHHVLLRNDVVVIEGLRLGAFPGGAYAFTVLPLALAGADGAPCRAFIGFEEETS